MKRHRYRSRRSESGSRSPRGGASLRLGAGKAASGGEQNLCCR